MIVASIDIGTNTVLLLIAEVIPDTGIIKPLRNEYRMPRIGQGIMKSGFISFEKMSLLYDVLNEYDIIIKSSRCDKVILTGTNAFRIAKNTSEIINEIRNRFNYELKVISGDEEAEYAYYGAISGYNDNKESLVIDIGGSSTEIIYGIENQILNKISLQLGSVSGTEQFLKHNPPLKEEINSFTTKVKEQLSSIKYTSMPERIIAVAGTATTLACMKLGLKDYDDDKVDGTAISYQELNMIVDELSQQNSSEILNSYGSVMKGREDIIFAGALILLEFMQYQNFNSIFISNRGIRYGAIVKYLMKSDQGLMF